MEEDGKKKMSAGQSACRTQLGRVWQLINPQMPEVVPPRKYRVSLRHHISSVQNVVARA